MNIELLLNYCMRFYARQFVTREVTNKDVVTRFETLLDDYFTGNKPHQEGLPSVKYFADKVCLSPNYFGDLIKKETGMSAQEYIRIRLSTLPSRCCWVRRRPSLKSLMTLASNIRSTSTVYLRRIPASLRVHIEKGKKV